MTLMQVLHMGLGYFKVTLHGGIAFRAKSSLKGIQTIQMGYFEATMHVDIAFRVDSSFKLAIHTFIFTFTKWNFGVSLQYLDPHLRLPTRILGLNCNICICTYFYQLGFWGLVTILAFNINIITILVFFHFKLFVLINWKQ
jgi:hypothetical protein